MPKKQPHTVTAEPIDLLKEYNELMATAFAFQQAPTSSAGSEIAALIMSTAPQQADAPNTNHEPTRAQRRASTENLTNISSTLFSSQSTAPSQQAARTTSTSHHVSMPGK